MFDRSTVNFEMLTTFNFFLQLRLTAHDTRYPNNRATATVTISVTRNLNSPRFIGIYSETILDSVPLGYQVLQVNATDDDNVSIGLFCIFNLTVTFEKKKKFFKNLQPNMRK